MKYKLFIPVVLFIVLSLSGFGVSGVGSELNPFVLNNCSSLSAMGLNSSAYYVLEQDLDCSGFIWNDDNIPLCANFGGVLDGRGYSIINFSNYGNNPLFHTMLRHATFLNFSFVNPRSGFNSSTTAIRFFGVSIVNTSFKDVHIINGELICNRPHDSAQRCTDMMWFGGELSGDSLIDRCSVSGIIEGHSGIGSFFQKSNDAISINNSYSSVHIKLVNSSSTASSIGGMVQYYAGIQNSFFNGTIENINASLGMYIGGCCGRYITGTVKNFYSSAKFKGNMPLYSYGLFAGAVNSLTATDVYVNNETGNCSYTGVGIKASMLNNSEMQKETSFNNWDFDNIWLIDEGHDFPKLSWMYPDIQVSDFNISSPDGGAFSLLNNSVFEYLAGLWSITYLVDSSSVIDVNINNVSNVSDTLYFNISSSVHPVVFGSSLIDDANPHNFYIFVNDTFYNSSSSIYFNISDSVSPGCSGLNDSSLSAGDTYLLSVVCIDESFDLFNLSCGAVYSYFNSSLDSDGFNFNDGFVVDETTECFYSYCDKFDNCVSDSFIISAVADAPDSGGVSVDLTVLSNTLINIFLLLFWVILLILTLTLKGAKAKTIQFLNIMQMLTGFVAGSIWMHDYFLIGFPLILVSLGFFVGLIMDEK